MIPRTDDQRKAMFANMPTDRLGKIGAGNIKIRPPKKGDYKILPMPPTKRLPKKPVPIGRIGRPISGPIRRLPKLPPTDKICFRHPCPGGGAPIGIPDLPKLPPKTPPIEIPRPPKLPPKTGTPPIGIPDMPRPPYRRLPPDWEPGPGTKLPIRRGKKIPGGGRVVRIPVRNPKGRSSRWTRRRKEEEKDKQ